MTLQTLYVENAAPAPQFTLDANRLRDAVNDPYEPRGYINVALGNAATVDIPGPAAGLVRLFDDINVVADALASAMTSVTFDLIEVGGTAYRFGRVTTITSSQAGHYIAVGYGEVVRVVNGGANTGRIVTTYVDVPADTVTLVRAPLSDTPTIVIPAPAAGYFRRPFSLVPVCNASLILRSDRQRWFNRDSVSHSLETYVGGTLAARGAPVATLVGASPTSPRQVTVTAATGDMTLRTVAAITTTAPTFVGSYETLPIPTTR